MLDFHSGRTHPGSPQDCDSLCLANKARSFLINAETSVPLGAFGLLSVVRSGSLSLFKGSCERSELGSQ